MFKPSANWGPADLLLREEYQNARFKMQTRNNYKQNIFQQAYNNLFK